MLGPDNNINTEFPTGSLDEFLNDMNAPKQDFNINIDDDPELNEYEAENNWGEEPDHNQEPDEKVDIQMKAKAARSGGKLIATVIDSALPAAMAYFADESPEHFKASESEKDDLTKALTEYMRLKGGDIPPGIMVIILVCAIYGCRIPEVVKLRKGKKQAREEEEREREELKKYNIQLNKNDADQHTSSSEDDNTPGN